MWLPSGKVNCNVHGDFTRPCRLDIYQESGNSYCRLCAHRRESDFMHQTESNLMHQREGNLVQQRESKYHSHSCLPVW